MQITHCTDYQDMSSQAASLVLEGIEKKSDLLLCVPTGSSPEGLYRELARRATSDPLPFSQLRIIKLDEWFGIPEKHPVSCEYFIGEKLLTPLGIPAERYISFASNPENPETECNRIRSRLDREGPIDICILGLGLNGHLGLNEPAPQLEPFSHVATLTEESLQHSMIASMESKPTYGLTLGMQEILASRKIIMLVSGKGKREVTEQFLEGKISTQLPASLLWLHQDVECLVDQSVL
ncbi:MAG: galactosamine-6-phosphate isomerase, partial [Bacteroidales bacterium]|nr:galactosamine-6-phosphate isomerase [Bacteroidales bacterium]